MTHFMRNLPKKRVDDYVYFIKGRREFQKLMNKEQINEPAEDEEVDDEEPDRKRMKIN